MNDRVLPTPAGGCPRVLPTPATTASSALLAVMILLAALLTGPGTANAQSPDLNQRERLLYDPFRVTMDEQAPVEKRVLFDWGGWLRSSVFMINENTDRDFDNQDDPYDAFTQQQFRLWGSLSLDRGHLFYARMKMDYINWHHGHGFYHGSDDLVGPDLERGWYAFQLSNYQAGRGETPGQIDLTVKVGREYLEVGKGLTLSMPVDMVQAGLILPDWELTGFGAMSIPGSYNVDRSIPWDPHESRRYWGVQVDYTGIQDHRPFIYYWGQDDQDTGRIETVTNGVDTYDQAFGYDSQYLGIGSQGPLFHHDLQYTTEFAWEFGDSHAWSLQEKQETIKAWAFDTEIRYFVPDQHDTELAVSYLLASGDEDRHYSPTNTIYGNAPGTDDNSFVGWGFRNTGLVLAPRISNLGMVAMRASTFPLRDDRNFRELKVGTDFYVFHKQQSEAAASDFTSSYTDNGYLGHELDLYADWRLTSDLAWMIRYGVFWPGSAFRDDDSRQLFFTGMTLNF